MLGAETFAAGDFSSLGNLCIRKKESSVGCGYLGILFARKCTNGRIFSFCLESYVITVKRLDAKNPTMASKIALLLFKLV